jgi:hypothetical protein
VYGCAAGAEQAATADDPRRKRDTRIVHEECDVDSSGAERLDANGDSNPDVVIVRSGGKERCRALDLNFDRKFDVWVYLDDAGQVRRKELDFDRDGRIDEILVFNQNTLVQTLRATSMDNKIDTWDFYEGGRLVRSERDSDGDSVVDQWWEYKDDRCPLIHSDADGDGRPDPGATVDYCKETGYVPPDRSAAAATGQSFERPGSLPTELENVAEGEGDQPAPAGDDPKQPEGAQP